MAWPGREPTEAATDRSAARKEGYLFGVISDTHGLLRPEAVAALQGVGQILHAGDVGTIRVLEGLREVAPVTAVRGNIDRGVLAAELPRTAVVEVGGLLLYLLHDLQELDLDPAAADLAAVVSGHSHRPTIGRQKGVLLVNPGSAGPRRFDWPVSVALLQVHGGTVEAQIIELEV